MANKIGIEVDVSFPSATEMQRKLAEKWKDVKKNFEGKINIGVDERSLKSLRTKVQNALNSEPFEIKVDVTNSIKEIGKLSKTIREIDEDLKRERVLKVNLDVVNLKSSLKDLMGSMETAQRQTKNAMSQSMAGFTDEIKNADKAYASFVRKYKLNKNGQTTSVITGQTTKDKLGASEKVTFTEDSKGMTANVELLHSKEKAVKAVKDAMEELYKIEKAMSKHMNNGDVEQFGRSQKEYINLQAKLRDLNKDYKNRYGENADGEDVIKDLQRRQQYERDSLKIAKQQEEARKEEEVRLKKINDEMDEYQKTINKAFDDYSKIQRKMESIQSDMATASGKHKDELDKQYLAMINKREALEKEHDLLNMLTAEQKKQLSDQRQSAYYAEQIVKAKLQEKALDDATSKIVQLEQKRFELAKKIANATGDEKKHLQDLQGHYNKILDNIKSQVSYDEKASTEQKQKVNRAKELLEIEQDLYNAQQRQKTLNEQEKRDVQAIKNTYGEVLSIRQRLAQLQGNKDKDGYETQRKILQQSLNYAEQLHDETRKQLAEQNRLTDAVKEQERAMDAVHSARVQEIELINRETAQQKKANQLLQDYQTSLRTISQLQRDLVFAGDRERVVIQRAISAEKQKLAVMKQEIQASERITDARKQEIDAIEKAQAEQLRLNTLRQEAREVDRVYDNAYGVTDFQSFYSSASQGVRAVIDGVKDVDEAFMRVAKVASESDEVLKEFKDTSYDVASGLGVASNEYMQAVEKWITAGYNLEQSEELGRISTIGSFVGNIDTDLMAKWMSVPLTTFKRDMIDANDIINTMNETSNNHAIEMEELGKAYMRGANSAQTAGVSFEELTGMITAAQEATRMGGERIGTSMKTISTNYLQIKGATEGVYLGKKEIFEGMGIDIENTKNLTELLGEVENIWGSLADVDKNRLLVALSGKEHLNVLTGIINQWDVMQEATAGSKIQTGLVDGESGSAYQEFEKQKESVRFQLAEVENAWLELMNTIADSDGNLAKILGLVTDGLQKASELAQNEKLMEVLKLILLGVGFHASTNGLLRAIDLMETGTRNMVGNMRDFTKMFKANSGAPLTTITPLPTIAGRGGSNGSNGSNGGSNGGSTGGGTIIRGGANLMGSTINRDTTTARKYKLNRGTPNSDKPAQDVGKLTDGLKETGGALAKGGKTVLKMLPIVGDAMLIMELAGIDVFDKIGKGINNLNESSEDYAKELAEKAKNLRLTSDLANGSYETIKQNLYGDGTEDNKGWKGLKKEDLKGENFDKFKEEFNTSVQELGFSEDIQITWNNYDDIMDKIAKYEEAQKKLREENAKTFAKEGVELMNDGSKTLQKADDEIEKSKKEIKALEEMRSEKEASLDSAKKRGDKGAIKQYQKDIDLLTESIEKEDKAIKKSVKNKEEVQTVYKDLGDTFAYIGKDKDALIDVLSNIEDAEGSTANLDLAVASISDSYDKAKGSLGKYKGMQDSVKKGSELTEEEFKTMMNTLYEVDETYDEVDYEDYIANEGNVRDAIQQTIDKHVQDQEELVKTSEQAVATATEYATSMGSTGDSIDGAKKKLQDMNTEARTIPKEITVEVKILKRITEIVGKVVESVVTLGAGKEHLNDTITKNQTRVVPVGSKSVSTRVGAVNTQGVTSANVSTNGGATVSNATSTKKSNTSTKKSNASTKKSDTSATDNATVSQDVWRYWKTEDKQMKLESAMEDLTRAIDNANGNSKTLAELYKKQLSNLEAQKSNLTSLRGAKTHEAQQRLSQLSAYGFKVDKNNLTISNLDVASKLKGDKATKAEELLNQWHSLVSEISSLDQQIKGIGDTVKETKIAQELNSYAKLLKSVEHHLGTIENRSSLNNSFLALIDGKDVELKMQTISKSAYDNANSMERLVRQFNNYAVSYVQFKENGEEFLSNMQSLRDGILENADALIENNKALNDMEMDRAINDIGEYNGAIDRLQSNLQNTRKNVQEGLLSGTKLSDLQSTKGGYLDLTRDNKLDKMAQQRLKLEKDLQVALDNYAKKNVDRERDIAVEKLKINQKLYNQLLDFETDFNNGKYITQFADIFANFNIATEDVDYKYNKSLQGMFENLNKKMAVLNEQFADDLASDVYETRLKAEYEYSVASLELENDINKQRIKDAKANIKEYNRQLADENLTQTQIDSIKKLVQEEEDVIVALQDTLKENIDTLYNYQFEQIDKMVSKYDEMASALDYSLSLIQAVSPKDLNAQFAILESMKDNEISRKSTLRNSIASLKQEMSLLEQGSFEWNIMNGKLGEYNQALLDANNSILEMNKELQSNQLENIFSKFEKKLFGGKTSEQFQTYQDLWLTGLERELALEEMYKKISDIGTDAFNQKMAVLEKQEKVSRLEADYLNKQMEIYELQQSLEDSKTQRGVKTLQQNSDGTFQWNYVADEDDVAERNIAIKRAQVELLNMEQEAKNAYLTQLQDIVTGVQSGEYGSRAELDEELQNLRSAYAIILGDIPATMEKLSSEIGYAYDQAKIGNEDLINELAQNGHASPVITTITSLKESIVTELKNLGDRVEKAVMDSLNKGADYSGLGIKSNNISTAKLAESLGNSFSIDKIEFPNATSSKEIQDALMNLPKYAMQYAKSKR